MCLENDNIEFYAFFRICKRQPMGTQGGINNYSMDSSMDRCDFCGQVNGHVEGCPNSGNSKRNERYGRTSGEIRCTFCGTINPASAKKCSSCNASLEGSVIRNAQDYNNGKRHNDVERNSYSDLRQPTEREDSESNNVGENRCCPECGYPLRKGSSTCPNPECPTKHKNFKDTEKEEKSQDGIKTEGSWNVTPSFRIGPCGKDGAITNAKEYETDEIVLGRDELLPGNNVLSHKHIRISNDGGQWYVEDLSSTHQTYITIKGKNPIENGDVLVLGNKYFRFETE